MKTRFLTTALFLSLFASDASAITIVCSEQDFLRIGTKGTMRIVVPAGGPDALKEALRSYASSHDLRFSSTWGVDGARFPAGYPPTIFVSTEQQGVAMVTTIATATNTAEIIIRTTCYADEQWEPHWDELVAFVAANNFKIVESIDSREIRKAGLRRLMEALPKVSLSPVTIE